MSEFTESKSLEEVVGLEAPKVKAPRKPRAQKVEFEAGANGPPASLTPLDTSFNEEELLEECTPVKKGKGRPKKVKEPVAEDGEPVEPKPKRKQTELQKQNFIRALEARKKNIELRRQAKELEKQLKEEQQEAKKAEVERKIVKKSICIKKKEILSQAALDEISDDEIPDSVIQKVISKQKAKKVVQPKPVAPVEPPVPKYNFV